MIAPYIITGTETMAPRIWRPKWKYPWCQTWSVTHIRTDTDNEYNMTFQQNYPRLTGLPRFTGAASGCEIILSIPFKKPGSIPFDGNCPVNWFLFSQIYVPSQWRSVCIYPVDYYMMIQATYTSFSYFCAFVFLFDVNRPELCCVWHNLSILRVRVTIWARLSTFTMSLTIFPLSCIFLIRCSCVCTFTKSLANFSLSYIFLTWRPCVCTMTVINLPVC